MAEGVTVANAFVQVMPSMEGATSSITSALVPGMSSAGNAAGAKFGSVFSGKAGAALKMAGGALAGVFAVGAMKDAFQTVEAGFNNVKIATGATGEQAKQLESVYLNVSKNVVGSFEDIGSAVGELNTRFGLNGEELEKASESAMKYAKVTGQDATKAVQDVSRMMNNAGIPASQYAETLDKLTVAGQQAGVDVGKLATQVNDNAASFKAMGFSTDEAIAMLASFEKSGVNTSAVLTGMRKGLKTFTDAGVPANEAFDQFVKGVQDGSWTMEDAMETFGAKAGATMYDAAKKGQLDFSQMYSAITEDSAGALESVYNDTLTAQEKFDILGKNLQAGFFQILEPIVTAVMPLVDAALSGVSDFINNVVQSVMPFIEQFSAAIMPIAEQVLPELKSVFDEVMGGIGEIVAEIWPDMQEVITTVMESIGSLLKDAWPAIKQVIETVMTAIKSVIQTVWPIISNIVKTATQAISQAIKALSPLLNFVKNVFEGIKKAIEDPIGTAKKFISDAINNITNIFSGLKLQLPKIALPHFNVWGGQFPWGIGGQGAPPTFSVDWYGAGGFSDEPTLNGYGERGLELYWPGYSPYFEKYAQGIAEHMPKGAGGVDIHDCTFVVREENDIRKVAYELNTLINRQTVGGFA